MIRKDHKKIKIAIGAVIKKYREEMNLSQEELSLLVYGKKEAQILVSRSELGSRNIPAYEIMDYIKVFKINPSDFFHEIQKEFSRL